VKRAGFASGHNSGWMKIAKLRGEERERKCNFRRAHTRVGNCLQWKDCNIPAASGDSRRAGARGRAGGSGEIE
jgi:hypothetical protein